MKNQNTDSLEQPDLIARAEAAFVRARQRAHEKAWLHGGTVTVWENGKIVHLQPEPPKPYAERVRNRRTGL